MKTLVFDIDGVFANFNLGYGRLLTKVGGDKLPKGWEENPDFPTVWDWDDAAGYTPEVTTKVWKKYIMQEGSDFWKTLEPLPTARETLMHLNGLVKKGAVECYFLTNRMGHNVKLQTEEFLYANGLDYPTVLIASDKVPWLRLLQPMFFVDDRVETIQDIIRVSEEETWTDFQLYLKQAPYNKALWERVNKARTVKNALILANLWEL